MIFKEQKNRGAWLEFAFALAIGALLARAVYWIFAYGVLPQPFFYEPSDTFMDWFNPAYWAHDIGTYDSWGTIYPPLTFVILKVLSIPSCYVGNEGVSARDCDWLGVFAIHAIFIVNTILIALTFLKLDRKTALPRSFALAAGMPMLFALERGNVLLLCFTCYLLAFGPLLKSAKLRWLFAGLAINFKVYIIAGLIARLLKGRWLWVEGGVLAAALVYLLSFGVLGVGTLTELLRNITSYSSGFQAANVLDIWYSVTYLPLVSLLEGVAFPVTGIIGSDLSNFGLTFTQGMIRIGQASLIVAAVATWMRPEVVPIYRVTLFGILFGLITSEAGGYTQILAIFLVFFEDWRGLGRRIAIILCYVLCLPGDIVIGAIPPFQRFSYLAGHDVEMNIGIGLGMLARPGLLIGIAIAVSCVTLHDVWQKIRGDLKSGLPILPTATVNKV